MFMCQQHQQDLLIIISLALDLMFSVVVAGVMLESDDSVRSLSEIENLPTVTTAYGRLFI